MRKSTMWAAGLAAAALAFGAQARAEDVDKAKADAQEKVDKAKVDAQKDVQKAEAKAHEKVTDAQKDANKKVEKAREKDDRSASTTTTTETDQTRRDRTDTSGAAAASGGMVGSSSNDMSREDRDTTANSKHHSVFDSKDNWNVKGRVARVSGNSVTLHRDDGPDVTLHTSSQTKIEVDGNHARTSQLKPGQDVRASFNLQGASPMAVDIKADSKSHSGSSSAK